MNNNIGERLLRVRMMRGETQEQVAEAVGISYVSMSRYENGQRMPKMDILMRLADHYGVAVDELMRDETKKDATQEGSVREKIAKLQEAIPDLTDEEADFLLASIAGIKAARKHD